MKHIIPLRSSAGKSGFSCRQRIFGVYLRCSPIMPLMVFPSILSAVSAQIFDLVPHAAIDASADAHPKFYMASPGIKMANLWRGSVSLPNGNASDWFGCKASAGGAGFVSASPAETPQTSRYHARPGRPDPRHIRYRAHHFRAGIARLTQTACGNTTPHAPTPASPAPRPADQSPPQTPRRAQCQTRPPPPRSPVQNYCWQR